MRPDGKRVKGLPPIIAAVPYIMPKRYDAMNTITEYIDEDIIKDYLRSKRKEGLRVNHMTLLISAYYKAVLLNPKLNYFIVNRKIFERNHFCVSFAILKTLPDGSPDETTLKLHFEPTDNIFAIQEKMDKLIADNSSYEQKNSTDKFASVMLSVPGLPRFVVWLARVLDNIGLLPRAIVELSPFHTSLFITNLASIKTSYIHHHCYDFGTTSVFICMGKPVPDFLSGNYEKKLMPLGVVMDERICSGYEFAVFYKDFRRFLKNPELLETPFGENLE